MSYEEYLLKTNQTDSRTAWKQWKIECCGMSEEEAIKESITMYKRLENEHRENSSSTAGDYSPSNPQDAPGMSIHDFIQSKYDISETDDEDVEW